MASFTATATFPTIKISGSKSLKITASASPFSILSTQSFGDISAYTEVSSGEPTSGTIGLWIYCDTDSISSITLRIGSSASDYTEITGIKTFTNAFDLQGGWNYFVFRLTNGATTGTPNWTATDYAKIEFVSEATPIIYVDLFTIGYGDKIGANELGSGVFLYEQITYGY